MDDLLRLYRLLFAGIAAIGAGIGVILGVAFGTDLGCLTGFDTAGRTIGTVTKPFPAIVTDVIEYIPVARDAVSRIIFVLCVAENTNLHL